MARILIVDDDPQIVKLIEVCLKRESFDVETAYDGVSALQKITSQENFDLIISDLMMPEMDGNTLLSSIKQIAPDTEVIMLTALDSTENAVKAIKLGAYDYITKPFTIKQLLDIVHQALEKRENNLKHINGVSGNLEVTNMIDIIQMLTIGKKTGTLTLKSIETGRIYFQQGKIIHCLLEERDLFGKEAFFHIMQWKKGLFEFTQDNMKYIENTISQTPETLLFEAMKWADEYHRK